jgi:TonB family protein
MKLFFSLLLFAFSAANAQTKITKYYDGNWIETVKGKAVFYADFIKDGNYYHATSYDIGTNNVRGKSTYGDTLMQLPVGLQLLYFKNGHLEDSSFYQDHQAKYSYHYYPNGQLEMRYYLPDDKKEAVTEGYDESGKRIKNYIFEKEAEFKGGLKAWVSYIKKNSAKDLTVKADEQVTATVVVEFIIDESGYVIAPKIRKSSGYKSVDNDALHVIADSPTWKNAIQFNQPVKAYRLQPFTYILLPQKK